MNMKTPGYVEYEKLCEELDRKTKEACEEFKRGVDRLCNQDNHVPWDWSTTPPWLNVLHKGPYGNWRLFEDEPMIHNGNFSIPDAGIEIPEKYHPKWCGDWKLSKTMRHGYKEVAR